MTKLNFFLLLNLILLLGCGEKSPFNGTWVTEEPVTLEEGGDAFTISITADLKADANGLSGSVSFDGMPAVFVDNFGRSFPIIEGIVSSNQVEFVVNPFNPDKAEVDAYKFLLSLEEGDLVGFWTENDLNDPDFSERVVFHKTEE